MGVYYAVFTGKGEYTGTTSTSFSIRASNDLSAAEVTCKKYYVYTGQPVQVEDLQVTLNGLVLTEGKDYTVWYDTNGYVSQTPPVGTPPPGKRTKASPFPSSFAARGPTPVRQKPVSRSFRRRIS